MQELLPGQRTLKQSIAQYDRESAERYHEFCFKLLPNHKSQAKRRRYSKEDEIAFKQPKQCLICGTTFCKKEGERTSTYQNRQGCSKECSYKIMSGKRRATMEKKKAEIGG